MDIAEQIKFITEPLDKTSGSYCSIMNCPQEQPIDAGYLFKGIPCKDCIGDIPLSTLKQIEPNITKENLEDTLRIWEILVK